MTDSICADLCNQPTQPVSTEKYTTLVYDSTTQLHQPVQLILSTLDRRAMALTKLANFESALRDAQVMQQISPSSPLGYIRAATIYSEQGKQRHVIDVCNKGLVMMDRGDMHHATLQSAKADAEQRQRKRIDFISQLPVDIVTTMLIPMFVDDDSRLNALKPCPYLHVSNLWRDHILQCSGGLRFETGYMRGEQDLGSCWQLIRFARHIKELRVRGHAKGTWLSDLLHGNDFCSLKELYIENLMAGYDDGLIGLLESISKTLTHLEIHEAPYKWAPMARILSACPRLVSFTICESDCGNLKSLPMTTWPNMTALSLTYKGEQLDRSQIISICQHFPALKKLSLCPFPDIESTLVIPQYCPLLKCAELDIKSFQVRAIYSDQSTASDDFVVTKLSMYMNDFMLFDEFVDIIDPVLIHHHTTLEEMQYDINVEWDIHDLDNIQYPRLKKLSLIGSAPSILPHAPILEELHISSTAVDFNPAVLNTIPSTLKKLELMSSWVENETGIPMYLERVTQQCQLQELTIEVLISDGFGNILNAVSCMNTLQRLTIKFDGTCKPYQLEGFFGDLVTGCPHLSCLEVDCNNANPLSTCSINSLKRLRHLKQLAFPIKHTHDYDSFWHAIRTFSQLTSIRIFPMYAVNKEEIRGLKEHRPSLNIIVDDRFKRF